MGTLYHWLALLAGILAVGAVCLTIFTAAVYFLLRRNPGGPPK